MTPRDFIDRLGLPAAARVDRVVPKKLLVENGAPTAADRKAINAGVERIHWLAALKPSGIGVPEFKDETHRYIEIAVVAMVLRAEARLLRLTELLHRAIPYPVLLLTQTGADLYVSVAEKRLSERQTDKIVLETGVTYAALPADDDVMDAFSLAGGPKANLRVLYQGWRAVIEAIQASAISGRFELLREAKATYDRREAIERHDALISEMARLRNAAAKERQVAKQVELNLQIKQLQTELEKAKSYL